MSNTAIETNPIRHRMGALRKVAGFLLVASLLPAVPASAAGLVMHAPASVSRHAGDCAFPQLPLQINAPLVLRPSTGHEFAGDTRTAENRWATGATSDWHAGMNRAVDRLVSPPENANVYAVQTDDRLDGRFGAAQGRNATLAGFAIVIH